MALVSTEMCHLCDVKVALGESEICCAPDKKMSLVAAEICHLCNVKVAPKSGGDLMCS